MSGVAQEGHSYHNTCMQVFHHALICMCNGVQGGAVASGGLRELIPTVARTAVAVGVDGIFMEVPEHLSMAPSFCFNNAFVLWYLRDRAGLLAYPQHWPPNTTSTVCLSVVLGP